MSSLLIVNSRALVNTRAETHLLRGEELADLLVGVRVGTAHEPVPDHADAERFLRHVGRLRRIFAAR